MCFQLLCYIRNPLREVFFATEIHVIISYKKKFVDHKEKYMYVNFHKFEVSPHFFEKIT